MLKKTITIDDTSFEIGQLSMYQVEEIMYGDKLKEDDSKAWGNRAWQTVLHGLNNPFCNSEGNISEGKEVHRNDVAKKITLKGFNALHASILEFSGLKSASGEQQPEEKKSTSDISAPGSSVAAPVVQ